MPTKKEVEEGMGLEVKVTEKVIISEDGENFFRVGRDDEQETLIFKIEGVDGDFEIDLGDAEILIETIAELAELKVSFK